MLFPPSVGDMVPRGHLSQVIRDLVREELDLSAIYAQYSELRGYPPYHPALMTALLLYAYCRGIYSSRRIEEACEVRADFMALTGMSKPDHSTICKFRVAKMRKLASIEAARARLEVAAQEEAQRLKAERDAKEEETGRRIGGKLPRAFMGKPEDKAQSNFTDPESRIMKTKDGYEQAYNCQAAVDSENQVIVACSVTYRQNDGEELVPLVEQIKALTGEYPEQVSADTNYCSEANIVAMEEREVDSYIATGRQKHGAASPISEGDKRGGPRTEAMREKLKEGGFESPYRLRKQVVEPVFGQIKEARGFRQFLHRGLKLVTRDWSMICTAHNLLKLCAARAASAQTA